MSVVALKDRGLPRLDPEGSPGGGFDLGTSGAYREAAYGVEVAKHGEIVPREGAYELVNAGCRGGVGERWGFEWIGRLSAIGLVYPDGLHNQGF